MYTQNGWIPAVFNDFFNTSNMARTNATAPAINVLVSPTQYVVELAAPGLKKEDFDVSINQEGNLAIKMEKKPAEQEQGMRYLRREFAYTKFEQSLILPDDVDRQQISARVADGVLTVVLPKINKEEQKVVRNITIG